MNESTELLDKIILSLPLPLPFPLSLLSFSVSFLLEVRVRQQGCESINGRTRIKRYWSMISTTPINRCVTAREETIVETFPIKRCLLFGQMDFREVSKAFEEGSDAISSPLATFQSGPVVRNAQPVAQPKPISTISNLEKFALVNTAAHERDYESCS